MGNPKPLLYKRRKLNDGTYPIVIRLIEKGKQKYFQTGYRIKERDWDGQYVKRSHPKFKVINQKIDEVVESVYKKPTISLNEYLLSRSKQYKARGSMMYHKLIRIEKDVRDCLGEILFSDLTAESVRKYEAYLINVLKNHQNTRARKLSYLRQYYDQAVQEGLANYPNPFKTLKISKVPTKKEKLTEAEISLIEKVKLEGYFDRARDLFLFSYYCRGMRFENCVTLKRSQVKADRIEFKTNKGKKYLSVPIHTRLRKILDKYKGKTFVFPFLKELPADFIQRRSLLSAKNALVNKGLKRVAELTGIDKKLTMHIARHSFANQLKRKTNNIHVIKDSLGHSSTNVTEQYLAGLDDEYLDKEVSKVYD